MRFVVKQPSPLRVSRIAEVPHLKMWSMRFTAFSSVKAVLSCTLNSPMQQVFCLLTPRQS
jgi:hypothetical protein